MVRASSQKRGFPFMWVLAGLVVGVVAYVFLKPHGPSDDKQQQAQQGLPVNTVRAEAKSIIHWTEVSGRLEAVNAAEIRPQVSGVITGIHFEDGAEVKRGQPLFTIDPRPYEAALQTAQGALSEASGSFERAKKLIAIKAISQGDFVSRKGLYDQALGRYKAAEVDLGYTHIVAPFSGRISRAEVTLGNLVQPGQTLLATIVDLSPIYASFDLDEATFLQTIKNESTAALRQVPVEVGLSDETGTPMKATIHSFDNQIVPGSGTIRVRAKIANADKKLIPGLFARVRIGSAEEKPAVLINPQAVGTDQSKKFVMLVGEGNKATYKEVTLGPIQDGLQVITSGLQGGEQVIVSNLMKLRPGAPVQPTDVDNLTLVDPNAPKPDAAAKTEGEQPTAADAKKPEADKANGQ